VTEPAPDQSVNIDKAETVNVPGDLSAHPAVIYLVAFVTVGVLIGFGWVTFTILDSPTAARAGAAGVDPATKGAVIQTWNNLAVAAAAVWTSSTLVGRLKGARQ
jgi:hypothetical protein